MRLAISAVLALLSTSTFAAADIRIVNDAQLSADAITALGREYQPWAERVYRYNHVAQAEPVTLVVSRNVRIGYYMKPTVYLPQDDDSDEMLETFVHELSHHATGHDSSFFFKEGIATCTTEALFKQDGRIPQGWPQYGKSTDAWVSLFMLRNELLPLDQLVDSKGYGSAGFGRERDFRGWQSYLIAANFLGWLIEHEGYAAFQTAFREESLGEKSEEWERRWLADLKGKKLPPFNAGAELPRMQRYEYYARRLDP